MSTRPLPSLLLLLLAFTVLSPGRAAAREAAAPAAQDAAAQEAAAPAAQDVAAQEAAATDSTPAPTVQERWGWSPGTVAANTAEALAHIDPVQVALPDAIARHITGETALLYFSPTCPHCRHAMPELNTLGALQPDLAWVGVASSRATQAQLDEFVTAFDVDFPVVVDSDRRFSWVTGARSTPSLFLAVPAPPGATPTSGDEVPPGNTVVSITEAWLPYTPGLAPVIALRRNATDRTRPDGQVLPADLFRDFQGYQGTRACSACHSDEATSWALTHHAAAYATLYNRQRAEDLQCVGCHVTGFTEGTVGSPPAFEGEGGFALGDHASPFADVGCEACHGPAGPHDGDPTTTPAGDTTPEAACTGCHDADHSVAFSPDKGVPHLDHYAATGMDEDALRARLDALADGSAARPLLAFPVGDTVGAAACRSCHKAEHKGWSKHAHAAALDDLGDDRGRADCVACHATRVAYGEVGASSSSLDAFREDEGVGCEACHGPGGAHVAAPTATNIVALGESCPECVLEAICTSCHDTANDPGWDLHQRLDALPYGR